MIWRKFFQNTGSDKFGILQFDPPLAGTAIHFVDGPGAPNQCLVHRGVCDEYVLELRVVADQESLYGLIRTQEDMTTYVGRQGGFYRTTNDDIAAEFWDNSRLRTQNNYSRLKDMDLNSFGRSESGLLVGVSASGAYAGRLIAVEDIQDSPPEGITREIHIGYDYANNRPGGSTWCSSWDDLLHHLAILDPIWIESTDREVLAKEFI